MAFNESIEEAKIAVENAREAFIEAVKKAVGSEVDYPAIYLRLKELEKADIRLADLEVSAREDADDERWGTRPITNNYLPEGWR